MDTQTGRETGETWTQADEARALEERLRAGGVRLATKSLDRPRTVVKPRPAWLAFLMTLVSARS
jgi:hypothetical protein